jgi:hypothetical protein
MNAIACVSGVELLMDFLEGVLAPDVHEALVKHVAGCPRCAAFVSSYLDTPRILREATTVVFPADVDASLKTFLRARTTAFRTS